MTALKATLTHDGIEYDAQLAVIERTMLGYEDHGIFTVVLDFAGIDGSWHQNNPACFMVDNEGRDVTKSWVESILSVLGVNEWEKVQRQRCLVLRKGSHYSQILGVADLSGNRVLIFSSLAPA